LHIHHSCITKARTCRALAASFKEEKRNARLEEGFRRTSKRDISRRQHGEASLRILDEKHESHGFKMPPVRARLYSRRRRAC
jgi:predicted ATPase